MAEILNQAADMIGRGWLQHGWFAYLDDTGQTHIVTAYNVHQMTDRPVAACLVGAVAQAGGGMSNIRTQAVQRALDFTWHTLFEIPAQANHWTPALRFARTMCVTSLVGTTTRAGPRHKQRHFCAVARLRPRPKPRTFGPAPEE
jgi:hypothetical protein